jgi:hypothetical protein
LPISVPCRFSESFWLLRDFSHQGHTEEPLMSNLGTADRAARAVAATIMIAAAFLISLPIPGQIALAAVGTYVLGTAVVGTCLGYRLMGKSTCPAHRQSEKT